MKRFSKGNNKNCNVKVEELLLLNESFSLAIK